MFIIKERMSTYVVQLCAFNYYTYSYTRLRMPDLPLLFRHFSSLINHVFNKPLLYNKPVYMLVAFIHNVKRAAVAKKLLLDQ